MKLQVMTLALVLGSLAAEAQIERTVTPPATSDSAKMGQAPRKKKAELKEIISQLDLTRAQKIKLKQMRDENQSKKSTIESNDQLSEDQKKKQLRELKKEQAEKLQSILTDEQKEKFKALRAKSPGDTDR